MYGKFQAVPVKMHPKMHHPVPVPTAGSGVCPAPLVLQQSGRAWSVVQSFGGGNSSHQLNHTAGTVLVPRTF